jgi:Zn-dependent peptidase ImmA (M78 family)
MLTYSFKVWAENAALAVRRRLGVQSTDPIDMRSLASQMGARVITPQDVPGLEEAVVKRLLEEDPTSWSAITIRTESKTIIVVNSTHSPARQASNIAHELAHLLTGHAGSKTGVSQHGLLLAGYDRQQEDEAGWLAGCLLLPRIACMEIKKQGLSETASTKRYGISPEMLKFRLNASGAERNFRATSKKARKTAKKRAKKR